MTLGGLGPNTKGGGDPACERLRRHGRSRERGKRRIPESRRNSTSRKDTSGHLGLRRRQHKKTRPTLFNLKKGSESIP